MKIHSKTPLAVDFVKDVTSTECAIDQPSIPCISYFDHRHTLNSQCITQIQQQVSCNFILINSLKDVGDRIDDGCDFLIFHADMIVHSANSTPVEFVDAIHTLSKYTSSLKKLSIGVIVSKKTSIKVVRDLQKTCVQGVLLDYKNFPIDLVVASIKAFISYSPHWPADVLKQLPGAKKKKEQDDDPLLLTHRQQQVLELIQTRGASNKAIAKMLGISESTVKLHVTGILKKKGVQTRTQLAVFSTINKN